MYIIYGTCGTYVYVLKNESLRVVSACKVIVCLDWYTFRCFR